MTLSDLLYAIMLDQYVHIKTIRGTGWAVINTTPLNRNEDIEKWMLGREVIWIYEHFGRVSRSESREMFEGIAIEIAGCEDGKF